MRRISAIVLTAAVAASTMAAATFANFTGAWDVVVNGPQGAMASTLTLEQKSDSISGTFESEVGSAKVAGFAKGDSLFLAFAIDAGGQMINLTGVGALKDKDNLEGKIVAEGMGEFPYSAKRK